MVSPWVPGQPPPPPALALARKPARPAPSSFFSVLSEMVILVREPENPYDRWAIRVDNVRNVKVGHLPRKLVCFVSGAGAGGPGPWAIHLPTTPPGDRWCAICTQHQGLVGRHRPLDARLLRFHPPTSTRLPARPPAAACSWRLWWTRGSSIWRAWSRAAPTMCTRCRCTSMRSVSAPGAPVEWCTALS